MLTWAILFQTLNAYINFILIKNQIPFLFGVVIICYFDLNTYINNDDFFYFFH